MHANNYPLSIPIKPIQQAKHRRIARFVQTLPVSFRLMNDKGVPVTKLIRLASFRLAKRTILTVVRPPMVPAAIYVLQISRLSSPPNKYPAATLFWNASCKYAAAAPLLPQSPTALPPLHFGVLVDVVQKQSANPKHC